MAESPPRDSAKMSYRVRVLAARDSDEAKIDEAKILTHPVRAARPPLSRGDFCKLKIFPTNREQLAKLVEQKNYPLKFFSF